MRQQLQLIRDRYSDTCPAEIETQNWIHITVIPNEVEELSGIAFGSVTGSFDSSRVCGIRSG
jgi:hypothetical protein